MPQPKGILETLAAGLPVFYLDNGVELTERPDGRRFEIGWIVDASYPNNCEIVREVAKRVR